jgi:hypothetical protein
MFGKDYSLEEIIDFFRENKNFIFSGKFIETVRQTPHLGRYHNHQEEEKVNFYESNILSTANFNNEYILSQNSLKMKSHILENEVVQSKVLDSIQSLHAKDNSMSLANYISYGSKLMGNNSYNPNIHSNIHSRVSSNYNERLRRQNTAKSVKENNPRSDSEEKACQTDKADIDSNNLNIIASSRKFNSNVNTLEENKLKEDSSQVNNIFINNMEEKTDSTEKINILDEEELKNYKENKELNPIDNKESFSESLKNKSTMFKKK